MTLAWRRGVRRRALRAPFVVTFALGTAAIANGCGSKDSGTSGGSGDGSMPSLDSGPADAGSDRGADALVPGCSNVLVWDAGLYSSLNTFPIASECAQAGVHSYAVTETVMPCGGSILVQTVGPDCQGYYLYDATSGALEASGGGCNVLPSWECVPGFVFPSACWAQQWPGPEEQLCTDAGPEAGVDAPQSTDGAVE